MSRFVEWKERLGRYFAQYFVPEEKKVRQAIKQAPFPRPSGFRTFTDEELAYITRTSKCPYCCSGLYEGPTGGMSMNLFCSNSECRARLNYSGFTGEYVGESPAGLYEEVPNG